MWCHPPPSDAGHGACSGGRIGDGAWDRFAYFKSNSASGYVGIWEDLRALNVAVAAWMIGLVRGAMIDDEREIGMLRAATRDRRHMLQAAGFLAVLPWTLEW